MIKDSTRRYYETNANEYFRATYSIELSYLWSKLEERLKPGALILDLGCGSGRDLLHFSQRGFQAIGIDYSHNLTELAKSYSPQPVILGDFTHLPFKKGTFDAVWAIGSLLHVPRISLPAVLSAIHRVLKPDSLFLTSVKKGSGEVFDSLGRFNVFYQPDEWGEMLEEQGFEIIEMEQQTEIRPTDNGTKTEVHWIVCLAAASGTTPERDGKNRYQNAVVPV